MESYPMKKNSIVGILLGVDLSYLLAAEALMPWDSINSEGYLNGALRAEVRSEAYGSQIRALADAQGQVMLVCQEIGNHLEWRTGAIARPQPLSDLVLALGGTDGEGLGEGSLLLRLDADEFARRLAAVDATITLARFLRKSAMAEQALERAIERVFRDAMRWHTIALSIIESGPTTAKMAEQDEVARQLQCERFGIPPATVERIDLQYDPRGRAFAIYGPMSGHCGLSIVPVRLDWRAGQPKQAAGPKAAAQTASTKAVPTTSVPKQVLDDLRAAVLSAGGTKLVITKQLSPSRYRKVADLLDGLGGRWHTGQQAHLFAQDFGPQLQDLLETGSIRTSKDYEFFPTPDELVHQLLDGLPLQPGMRVLEPNAGEGAIADQLAARLGSRRAVTCYELWPRNVDLLRKAGYEVGRPTDFLEVLPPATGYDAVVLNPPFSGGRDVLHVTHALRFVRPGGRLHAITSTNWQRQDTARNREFMALLTRHGARIDEIPAGAFKCSGTNVPTLMVRLQVAESQHEPPVVAPALCAADFF